jgi:DNA-binding beta-propeller fold protein YncE
LRGLAVLFALFLLVISSAPLTAYGSTQSTAQSVTPGATTANQGCPAPPASPATTSTVVSFSTLSPSVPNPNYIAYDSGNSHMYVSSIPDDLVGIINTGNQQVADIGANGNLQGIAYDSVTGHVYVVSDTPVDGHFYVYDLMAPGGTPGVELPANAFPQDIQYDAKYNALVVSDYGSSEVSIISPISTGGGTLVKNIVVAKDPYNIAIDPITGYAFVYDQGVSYGGVSIIGKGSSGWAQLGVLSTEVAPSVGGGIAFNPVNSYLFVANYGAQSISVFNATGTTASSYSYLYTLIGTGSVSSIGVDCTHNTLWLAVQNTNSVAVLSECPGYTVGLSNSAYFPVSESRLLITTLSSPSLGLNSPAHMAYDPVHQAMFVTNYLSNPGTVTEIATDQAFDSTGNFGCPIGVADFGINGAAKNSYDYGTSEFNSTTTFDALGIGTSTNAKQSGEMSLQLNVESFGIPVEQSNGTYWTQDVLSLSQVPVKNGATTVPCSATSFCYQLTSEFFNQTINPNYGVCKSGALSCDSFDLPAPSTKAAIGAPFSSATNKCTFYVTSGTTTTKAVQNCELIAPQCTIINSNSKTEVAQNIQKPGDDTYLCTTPWIGGLQISASTPLTVNLGMTIGTAPSGAGAYAGYPSVTFSYKLNQGAHKGKWVEYDAVYFDNKLPSTVACGTTITENGKTYPLGVACPGFFVGGKPLRTPSGNFWDAENVLCAYSEDTVNITSLSATMKLLYLPAGKTAMTTVPHAFAAGADTAENVVDVTSYVATGGKTTATLKVGTDAADQIY